MPTLVDELGLDALALGTAGFAFRPIDHRDALASILSGVDAGIGVLDTAKAYTRRGEEATAERLVGEALSALPKGSALVSTKGGHWRDGDAFPVDGSARTLRAHCEASLRALRVDQIDIYYLHHVDPVVPLAESVGALAELQTSGLIRHIGLSNVSVGHLDAAAAMVTVSAVQNKLSLGATEDLELARDCMRRGIAYFAYSPLGGIDDLNAVLGPIAQRCDASTAQVMLAGLWSEAGSVTPVLGATRPETIRDCIAARQLFLPPQDVDAISGRVHAAGKVRGSEGYDAELG